MYKWSLCVGFTCALQQVALFMGALPPSHTCAALLLLTSCALATHATARVSHTTGVPQKTGEPHQRNGSPAAKSAQLLLQKEQKGTRGGVGEGRPGRGAAEALQLAPGVCSAEALLERVANMAGARKR